MHRLSGCLAEQVPERDIHSRGGAHFHPGARKTQVLVLQRPPVPVHLQRRLAEQQGSHRLVDMRLNRTGAEERLAKTDEALVGVDVQP